MTGKLGNLKVHIFKKTEIHLLLGSINLPWIVNRLWLISRVKILFLIISPTVLIDFTKEWSF